MNAYEILEKSIKHMRDRASTYDKPDGERSMGKAVAALNIILGREALTESEGWLLLQILKDVRDRQRKEPHQDSLEDCAAYAALKAEARMLEKLGDGWIEHTGTEIPVDEEAMVVTRLSCGEEYGPFPANEFYWDCDVEGRNIIAYKIVKDDE